jgi:hypothetical protein
MRRKFEYRNPKFETNSNEQNKNTMFQSILIQIRRFGFSEFEIYFGCGLFRISCIGFEISIRPNSAYSAALW